MHTLIQKLFLIMCVIYRKKNPLFNEQNQNVENLMQIERKKNSSVKSSKDCHRHPGGNLEPVRIVL